VHFDLVLLFLLQGRQCEHYSSPLLRVYAERHASIVLDNTKHGFGHRDTILVVRDQSDEVLVCGDTSGE